MAQVPIPLFQIGDLVIFLSQLEVGVFVVTGGPFGPNDEGVFSYIIESVDDPDTGFGNVAEFDLELFVPAGPPPPPPPPDAPPPVGDLPKFRRGDIVVFVPAIDPRQFVVTNLAVELSLTGARALYTLVALSGTEDRLFDIAETVLDFEPGRAALEARIAATEEITRTEAEATRGEVILASGRTLAEVQAEAEAIRAEVIQVPTAVAVAVGPLVEEQGNRIASLIEGIGLPDLGDLIGVVPDLVLFLLDPLEAILGAGGGVTVDGDVNVSP